MSETAVSPERDLDLDIEAGVVPRFHHQSETAVSPERDLDHSVQAPHLSQMGCSETAVSPERDLDQMVCPRVVHPGQCRKRP